MRPDVSEALRYLGIPDPPEELFHQADQMADELSLVVQPKYAYRSYRLDVLEERILLQGTAIELTGSSAKHMLSQCSHAIILACTLGVRFDTLLLSIQARDMAKAVIYDALGSALVEAGCNAAEQEIAARFPDQYLTDRFSPGYGDLPLALQPSLCAALDVQRRLGLTVTPSLLMNPVKSVTAIIGLSDTPQPARGPSFALRANDRSGGLPTAHIRGCGSCDLRESCQFRKEGNTCGS